MNYSPDLQAQHSNGLKRSLSTESLERALKRARPFRNDSPIISVEDTHQHLTTVYPSLPPSSLASNYTALSTIPSTSHSAYTSYTTTALPVIKSISISTKTHPTEAYRDMNGLLSAVHRERFGDPEGRESWWTREKSEDEDEKMEEDYHEYYAMNSVLRQAHLQRKNIR
ncbi:hypothetical protein BD560DRAFT_369558 [Blakeslea trispora]|nr:hypothetical protein BD560DRAFT_369558 [Blakeslea trispora]